ncbi:MAG: polysaccharide deacetylase family protein [Verrucomicrobiales bacterium]|nr:polysaccharide deacetylase family protein [Verrucomicrobiales bacterium]
MAPHRKVFMHMGIPLKSVLPMMVAAFALSSCQMPGAISRDPIPLEQTNLSAVIRIPVGLEAPTWDSVKTRTSTIPGWDREIDATYFSIQTSEKVIAITFDDGPHGVNTPRLLDMLKKRNVKATFYVVGNMVKYNPQLLRRMIAEGHEIGNHTVTHGTLSKMSDTALRKELQDAHDMIVKETGIAPRSMRPPGGAIKNDQKKLMLKEFGYPTILWSVDPEDWKKPGASVVTSRLVNGAKPGGILLVHDLNASTVDAMPSTLDQLLAQGYRFVTVTELIMMDESYEGE